MLSFVSQASADTLNLWVSDVKNEVYFKQMKSVSVSVSYGYFAHISAIIARNIVVHL